MGKRKYETIAGQHVIIPSSMDQSTPDQAKSRKLESGQGKPIVYTNVGLSTKYDLYTQEQLNLENLR